MIVIVGESASGKSTLQRMFIEAHPEYKKIVEYTTRPMRDGEVDGIDYHFVTKEAFENLLKQGFFVEHTEYRGWLYGASRKDCNEDNAVIVLNPAALRSLKRAGVNTMSVYLYVDRRFRLINTLFRGDDVDEAYRRNLSDVGQFDGVIDEVDYVIDNNNFQLSESRVLKRLEQIIKEDKMNR